MNKPRPSDAELVELLSQPSFQRAPQDPMPSNDPATPTGLVAELTRRTVSVQASYAILKRVFDIAARFEWVDDNVDVDNEGDFFGVGAAVNSYIFEGHLKVQLFFQHRAEQHGIALNNDVVVLQLEGRF